MIDQNERVITGTVSGGSVTYTTDLNHNNQYSVQVKWSGSGVTGETKLQASLNSTDFVDFPDSTVAISGSSGGHMYDVTDARYNLLKIVCTSTSGAITFDVWLTKKRESKLG
jgi:hypothetical protein